MDFSSHTGVAVALSVSLGRVRALWWAFAGPLLVVYAGLMVTLDYHTPADIATTAAAVAPAAWLAHRLRGR